MKHPEETSRTLRRDRIAACGLVQSPPPQTQQNQWIETMFTARSSFQDGAIARVADDLNQRRVD
jgi:hypothetical protein